jgi:hypothetical protein
MDEDPNKRSLKKRYGIVPINDDRELEYRENFIRLSKKNEKVSLFANTEDVYKRTIMIQAIVCDQYTLRGTDSPVMLNLKNGETKFDGVKTYKDTKHSDVLLPGDNLAAFHTVFEPPNISMEIARREFSNWTREQCSAGIRVEKTMNGDSNSTMLLCVELDDRERPICPLGYMIYKQTNGGTIFGHSVQKTVCRDGKTRDHYIISEPQGMRLLEDFYRNVRDPRPVVVAQDLCLESKIVDAEDPNYVLCMHVGVYYYIQ